MRSALALLAVRSLHAELVLHPKPGLVTPLGNGSHRDMDATTFLRSLFSLRHYFKKITQAGRDGAGFDVLRTLGIEAERVMLAATAGINTHRGAIFSLGMLCAAMACADAPTPTAIRSALLQRWGDDLRRHAEAGVLHASNGAREEAALGFPAVFEIGLPRLLATLAAGRSYQLACIDTLFALIAQVSDTNVIHRGGLDGAATARQLAQEFLQAGGTAATDWEARADACNTTFVGLNLSPGGAADLLAATCFVHQVCNR